jgi:hypothetical protein
MEMELNNIHLYTNVDKFLDYSKFRSKLYRLGFRISKLNVLNLLGTTIGT